MRQCIVFKEPIESADIGYRIVTEISPGITINIPEHENLLSLKDGNMSASILDNTLLNIGSREGHCIIMGGDAYYVNLFLTFNKGDVSKYIDIEFYTDSSFSKTYCILWEAPGMDVYVLEALSLSYDILSHSDINAFSFLTEEEFNEHRIGDQYRSWCKRMKKGKAEYASLSGVREIT